MSLTITSEVIAAAYDYLSSTKPFCRWNLPDSEDVTFRVSKARDAFAKYHYDGTHCIEVSSASVGHTATLMEKLSHEIIHLHLRMTGMESRSNNQNVHNLPFRKLAIEVCKVHGFDLKGFY